MRSSAMMFFLVSRVREERVSALLDITSSLPRARTARLLSQVSVSSLALMTELSSPANVLVSSPV